MKKIIKKGIKKKLAGLGLLSLGLASCNVGGNVKKMTKSEINLAAINKLTLWEKINRREQNLKKMEKYKKIFEHGTKKNRFSGVSNELKRLTKYKLSRELKRLVDDYKYDLGKHNKLIKRFETLKDKVKKNNKTIKELRVDIKKINRLFAKAAAHKRADKEKTTDRKKWAVIEQKISDARKKVNYRLQVSQLEINSKKKENKKMEQEKDLIDIELQKFKNLDKRCKTINKIAKFLEYKQKTY